MKIGVYVFGLASVFAGILDLMLLVFSAFALAPLPFAAPHDHTAWGGNAYNLTVVGAALIAAKWLATLHHSSQNQESAEHADPSPA
jgi:hypothetical protein